MSTLIKTNVMRVLDARKISYRHYEYDASASPDGMAIATCQNQNPHQVFKTLVTVAKSNKNYVFLVPVCSELDLKRAAAAVGEKSLEMLRMRELLPLTGYVHGGCSPIGMKKQFVTVADTTAQDFDTIIISAGRIGAQVELAPSVLVSLVGLSFADICVQTS